METPAALLRTAAYAGDLTLVENLLREGVDPNVFDQHGRTALSHAAGQGHGLIVDALLAAGAWVDPHEDYDTHETPLMTAVVGGHFEIVKKLIAAGANPSWHVGVSQANAQFYARQNGHEAILKFLITLREKSG
jgi:ankyrin repeat protein